MDQIRIEYFGNAKIKKLRGSRSVDQDIAGLDVAMNDLTVVSVFDRGADLLEDLEPIANRQAIRIAIIVKRLTGDVLHYEVGNSV